MWQVTDTSRGRPTGRPLIHHVGVFASDHAASRHFYTEALRPLDIIVGYAAEGVAEFWIPGHDTPSLSLETAATGADATRGLHIAFAATDRAQVDAFFEAAVKAGGEVRHRPRHWPECKAYCAFVSDPDGNNVEALIKEAGI